MTIYDWDTVAQVVEARKVESRASHRSGLPAAAERGGRGSRQPPRPRPTPAASHGAY